MVAPSFRHPPLTLRPSLSTVKISDYDYALPDERIARFPLAERDTSKLLFYRGGEITESCFRSLPEIVPAGALMVFNNTKVIQARLHFRKPTGALIEVFCLEPLQPAEYAENFRQTRHSAWLCLIGNRKRWRDGELTRTATVGGQEITLTARCTPSEAASVRVDFTWNGESVSFAEVLDTFGELPIPPYLRRATQESDKTTYQTVYSKIEGSVAAPTAGLHFTKRVLDHLRERGVEMEELTLHVGAGTFRPVKCEEMKDHEMHTEHIVVSRQTVQRLLAHRGKAIAVGTTSVRTLESLFHIGAYLTQHADATEEELHVAQWQPYETDTDGISVVEALSAIDRYMERNRMQALHTTTQIIIVPGYRYRIVQAMVTNFHQPRSTLLLLVSAFVGNDWRRIYDYALHHDFRFLSYGDSSLLVRKEE